jgi:hypothetical protein
VGALAEVIGQPSGGRAEVRPRRQPDKSDHDAGLIEHSDFDATIGDGDGHVVSWDSAHEILLRRG